MLGRSLFREFENDPFFQCDSSFQSSMPGFNEFPRDGYPALTSGEERRQARRNRNSNNQMERPHRSQSLERDERGGAAGWGMMPFDFESPFKHMQEMFSGVQRMMGNMHHGMSEMQHNPSINGHTYMSSSVYSYDGRSGTEPKVYQAHHSMRAAPGGVREERKAMRNSETGEERMHLGRHIQDRGKVTEKRRNRKKNEEDQQDRFIGMDESNADVFDREWQDRVRTYGQYGTDPAALEDDSAHRTERGHRPRAPRYSQGKADLKAITSGQTEKETRSRGRH